MKITLDVADKDLYRAIKVEAARRERPVREIVEEALGQWLQRVEDEEDAAAAAAAMEDFQRYGGRDAAAVFSELAAETRARYGADER